MNGEQLLVDSCPSTDIRIVILGVVIGMFLYFFTSGVIKGVREFIQSLDVTCTWEK